MIKEIPTSKLNAAAEHLLATTIGEDTNLYEFSIDIRYNNKPYRIIVKEIPTTFCDLPIIEDD